MKLNPVYLAGLLVAAFLISANGLPQDETTKVSVLKAEGKSLLLCQFAVLNMGYLLTTAACSTVVDVVSQPIKMTPVMPLTETPMPQQERKFEIESESGKIVKKFSYNRRNPGRKNYPPSKLQQQQQEKQQHGHFEVEEKVGLEQIRSPATSRTNKRHHV